MTVIHIPDDQAAALTAQAAAQGFTLEAWLQKIAADPPARLSSIEWSQCSAVESVPGKVSGAWVLKNTRMPISAFFENLEAGASIASPHLQLSDWSRCRHLD